MCLSVCVMGAANISLSPPSVVAASLTHLLTSSNVTWLLPQRLHNRMPLSKTEYLIWDSYTCINSKAEITSMCHTAFVEFIVKTTSKSAELYTETKFRDSFVWISAVHGSRLSETMAVGSPCVCVCMCVCVCVCWCFDALQKWRRFVKTPSWFRSHSTNW